MLPLEIYITVLKRITPEINVCFVPATNKSIYMISCLQFLCMISIQKSMQCCAFINEFAGTHATHRVDKMQCNLFNEYLMTERTDVFFKRPCLFCVAATAMFPPINIWDPREQPALYVIKGCGCMLPLLLNSITFLSPNYIWGSPDQK